ncbi:MAG TPA: hypothetical protein VKT80_17380, partial [Chloroflexota bacterium]|nr:hypothetical protein [Chloroflexota bacterium]
MALSQTFSIGFLVLTIVGAGIVGTQSTWRETIAGLGIQYVGVAALVGLSSGPAAAIISVIVGAGVTLLLASGADFSGAAALVPDTHFRTSRARPGSVARERPRANNARIGSAKQIVSGLLARPFDASVFALAVVGAIALALTRPLFGSVNEDGAVNVLLIGGVLGCLLGGDARV